MHALKVHSDEPYRASPPGILLFHCIKTDLEGIGSSTFLDSFEIAERVREQDPDGFAALSSNPQPFRRHFDGDVDIITEAPVISVDEFGNVMGTRINDRVGAPLSIPAEQVPAWYRGFQRLLELAEDEQRILMRTLRPGDIAIFDNHRILHGRTRLNMSGERWLQWVQVNRGDFYSRLRIQADKMGLDRGATALLRGSY